MHWGRQICCKGKSSPTLKNEWHNIPFSINRPVRSLHFDDGPRPKMFSCTFSPFPSKVLTESFLTGLTYLAYGQNKLAHDEFGWVKKNAQFDFELSYKFSEKARIVQVKFSFQHWFKSHLMSIQQYRASQPGVIETQGVSEKFQGMEITELCCIF